MKTILFLIFALFLQSCNEFIFREINCRDVELDYELYWFPKRIQEEVVFNSGNKQITFQVSDQFIYHTTDYVSDTGCSCYDQTAQLITNGQDSIWYEHISVYQEGNNAETSGVVVISIGENHASFYTDESEEIEELEISENIVNDIISFSNSELFVNRVLLARNIGIIQIEFADGTKWTNSELESEKSIQFDWFNLIETVCN